MTENFLNRRQIQPIFQQMGREGMPQRMALHPLLDSGPHRPAKLPRQCSGQIHPGQTRFPDRLPYGPRTLDLFGKDV